MRAATAVTLRALLPLATTLLTTAAVAAPGALEPPPIPSSVFAARRARAAMALPTGSAVILHAGTRPAVEHDADFRVASDFYYLTGLDLADAQLVLERTRQGEVRHVLVLPQRDRLRERWEGKPEALSPAVRASFDRVLVAGDEEARRLLRTATDEQRSAAHSSLRQQLAAMRLRKDAHELARIEHACAITARSLGGTIRSLEAGRSERQIEALVRFGFGWLGARRAAFPPIVGSGPNSCILHHRPGTRRIRTGELVVLDVGAEYERYAADITRTVPASGRFSARQRAIYDVVLRAQQAAIAAVRPGVRLADVDGVAREFVAREAHGYRIPHGVCHWVGLDVHDVGELDTPLEPGMVLTVEPGIYLEEEQIGVRIEDTVLVTPDGCRVLSAGVPREPERIEALVREAGLDTRPFDPLPCLVAPRRARF